MNKTLQRLAEAAKTAPVRPVTGSVESLVERHIREILEGKWSVDDVLELQVDELSMATNAGNGADKGLGYSRGKDQWERIIRSYEEYLASTRTEASKGSAKRFISEATPEAGEEFVQSFLEKLKARGFKL